MDLGKTWERLQSRLGELAAEAAKTQDALMTAEEIRRLSQERGAAFQNHLGDVAHRLDTVLGETVDWLRRLNEAMRQAQEPPRDR